MTAYSAGSIARLRLRSLLLDHPSAKSVAEVARWFGAMQSQDLPSGKWSFGVRLPELVQRDVDSAIESAVVLRTWPMRGTLHFVASEDATWLLRTTGIKALAKAASRRAQIGLSAKTADLAADVLGKALVGGKRLTRAEALETLRAKGVKCEGQQGYHLLWYASQRGITCVGPNRGSEQTFVLLEDWAGPQRELQGEAALGELALRYFRGRGPASQQDFAGWSGLTAAEAKRGMAVAGKALVSLKWEGKTLWLPAGLLDEVRPLPRRHALALPGFDEYLLGIKDRSSVLAPEHLQAVIPGGNGVFRSTLIWQGRVVGTWTRTVGRSSVSIQAMPFEGLPPSARAPLGKALAAYGTYLELPVTVQWS